MEAWRESLVASHWQIPWASLIACWRKAIEKAQTQ
jgi:hypothetical protein